MGDQGVGHLLLSRALCDDFATSSQTESPKLEVDSVLVAAPRGVLVEELRSDSQEEPQNEADEPQEAR